MKLTQAKQSAPFLLASVLLLVLGASVLLFASALPKHALAQETIPSGAIWSLKLQGVIGPASSDFVSRQIETAAENGAAMVLLRMDTPGGLDPSMRDIIQGILASPIPVVTFVEPSGARAASAGTYILYASHVAAMAPATNLGAATPVQLGAPGLPETQEEPSPTDADQEAKPPAPGNAMERKMVNDAVAYIKGLAELRGRNAEWAERAVREGASLSAQEALEQQVIDLIARNVPTLLQELDQRSVAIGDGEITLETANATVLEREPDWRSQILAIITNPNVAYVLMLVGVYGLIFEFSNPGMGGPGILGAVCLLLAFYAFAVLPINYLGLALIGLGLALMVVEAFSPSFGVAGGGGLVCFIAGSVLLMDSALPAFQIALPVILAVALASAVLMIFVLGMVLRSRRHPVVAGRRAIVGKEVKVESFHEGVPFVRLQGELWQARCSEPLQIGDTVRVQSIDGLSLNVAKLTSKPAGEPP